jgi:hypothetical protein
MSQDLYHWSWKNLSMRRLAGGLEPQVNILVVDLVLVLESFLKNENTLGYRQGWELDGEY